MDESETEAATEESIVEMPVAVEEEEVIPYSSDTSPLTVELISGHISLIARTANGCEHAFTRLELHEKDITNLANLGSFPHLRYVVRVVDLTECRTWLTTIWLISRARLL